MESGTTTPWARTPVISELTPWARTPDPLGAGGSHYQALKLVGPWAKRRDRIPQPSYDLSAVCGQDYSAELSRTLHGLPEGWAGQTNIDAPENETFKRTHGDAAAGHERGYPRRLEGRGPFSESHLLDSHDDRLSDVG